MSSKVAPVFPEPNYTALKNLTPIMLFDLVLGDDLMAKIADKSNQYALKSFGLVPNITGEEIKVFIAILFLSGYVKLTTYTLFWSNSEDTGNSMVKTAMSRNRFQLLKRCFHLGTDTPAATDSGTPDRYKKVRLLASHIQNKFTEMFVPEQILSDDEAMIKYFGKSGLKQSLRNKPIRFGFKVWVLATVSGYVVCFDLYQGKGVGKHTTDNVKAVGSAGASVLDLLDMIPDEKRQLPYHLYADNFFSSQRLIEILRDQNVHYTGTIRKDRLKGKPSLTPVEKFKKKERGYHETVVLEDGSQVVTRWNDNAPITLISSILGERPMTIASRFSRTAKKYVDVP